MADSVRREFLLKKYIENRTSTNENDDKLLQPGLAYLTKRPADRRFEVLDLQLYHSLRKLVSDNIHADTILKIKEGFTHLEQYAVNLWRSPWRKEFIVVKAYTGFFKCKVERLLDKPIAAWLMLCLGYQQDPKAKDHFILIEPLDVHKVQEVSLDLFLATVDLQIIHEIASVAEAEGYSLKQAIKARSKTVRGKDEAISWLRREPKDESMKKKPKLDKDSGTQAESEDVGQTINKSPVNGRDERTSNGQRWSEQTQNEEANQSRPTTSDRQTKFPPSFTNAYSPSDRASTRDLSTAAHCTYNSGFGAGPSGTFVSDSYLNGVVRNRETQLHHLTDDMLYGRGDPSTDPQFPADAEMTLSFYSNSCTEDHHHYTQFSEELPLSSKEEKLYVNLPEKANDYSTSNFAVGLYQNLAAAPLAVMPESPPPTYADAVSSNGSNHDDFVVIDKPQHMDLHQVVPKDTCAGELPDRRNDDYNPQSYQRSRRRESDLSSINDTMSNTLTLSVNSTSRGTVDIGSSGNGDLYNIRTALYKPGSDVLFPDSQLWKRSQNPREPRRSVPGQASAPSDINWRRHLIDQHPPEHARDSNQDKVQGGSGTSLAKTHTSEISGLVDGKYQTSLDTPKFTRCEFCSLDASGFICESCFKMACENCQGLYNTDRCEKANKHNFVDVRKDNKKKSSQRRLPAVPAEAFETWHCARCTYANPAESSVCIMCSTTRGLAKPELPEPGSPVCRECTYCNKEGSEVCEVCGKSLRLGTAETTV